ncbi:MAG: hypothetical protein ACJ8DU_19480 [Microvirga sp.]
MSTTANYFCAQVRNWIEILDLRSALEKLLESRNSKEVEDYRVGKGAWKKVRDEVVPVSDHLEFWSRTEGQVRFAMNDEFPDCTVRLNGSAPIGLEVTIAQGKEDFFLAKELNKGKITPGFLGLQDTASKKKFHNAIARGRVMYSSPQALIAVRQSIALCLERKNNSKYEGHDLLIKAPLPALPRERWAEIQPDLMQLANHLPFRQVYVIGDRRKPYGFRLK